MKISRRKIIELIRESAGEMRSQEAIAHAQSMREDGLSFEDFTTLLLDYLEDQTNQQWSEEMLSDDWNFYDEWIEGSDPLSIGAEYLADAASYMMENKMKITKRQLRRIIREAVNFRDLENPLGGFASEDADTETKVESFKLGLGGYAYGGRRLISRDRAWLEFVPRGSPSLTREEMFRAVTLLEDGDPGVLKALEANPPKTMGPLDAYDVYSVHATTTG
jgi:hypothetical protein